MMSWSSRTYTPAAQVSGAAEPAGWPFWKPIEAKRRGRKVRQLPILLGDQAYTRTKAPHRIEQGYRLSHVTVDQGVLTSLLCEQRPEVSGALPAGCPGMP